MFGVVGTVCRMRYESADGGSAKATVDVGVEVPTPDRQGMAPVYHIKPSRVKGHVLVITHKCGSAGKCVFAGERERGDSDKDSANAVQEHVVTVAV